MEIRFRIFMISLVGVLVLSIWTLPRWWAVLNPESVTAVVFPGLPLETQADFVALPDNQKSIYFDLLRGDEDEEIPAKPDWALALVQARLLGEDQLAPGGDILFEPPVGSAVVATGEFSAVDAVRRASGSLSIYQLPDLSRLLRLSDDFASTRAPDIHLVLTRNPDPTDARGVGIDYIDLGLLQGNIGGQSYTVPTSADFSRYPVLALYSPQYDAVLAVATLRRR